MAQFPSYTTDDDGARHDLAHAINHAIALLAVDMDENGASASEISFARHDVIQTFCSYAPDTFQARRRASW